MDNLHALKQSLRFAGVAKVEWDPRLKKKAPGNEHSDANTPSSITAIERDREENKVKEDRDVKSKRKNTVRQVLYCDVAIRKLKKVTNLLLFLSRLQKKKKNRTKQKDK